MIRLLSSRSVITLVCNARDGLRKSASDRQGIRVTLLWLSDHGQARAVRIVALDPLAATMERRLGERPTQHTQGLFTCGWGFKFYCGRASSAATRYQGQARSLGVAPNS